MPDVEVWTKNPSLLRPAGLGDNFLIEVRYQTHEGYYQPLPMRADEVDWGSTVAYTVRATT